MLPAQETLGKLQGDAYEQNLGDKPGALKSLNKAVAIAAPLAATNPNDTVVLTALARAQDARGEVQSQTDDNNGAAASLQASIDTYNKLLQLPGVTPDLLFEAADVYDILGDLVGQDTGFGDAQGALDNYRKTITMNNRALALDPGFMRVRRGLVTMQMKLGNVHLESDPQDALLNFQGALDANDALPKQEQERLNMLRLHALLVRKKAVALSELGKYEEAIVNFAQAQQEYKKLAAADPKDFRALEDVHRELYDEASSYRNASDPRLTASPSVRQKSLLAAERVLIEEEAALRRLIVVDANESRFKASLDAAQAQLGAIKYRLHEEQTDQPMRLALTELKKDAARDDASPLVLDLVVTSFLQAQPFTLSDTAYTLTQAKRGAELTHRKSPTWLLSLAQAYRADGKHQEARETAKEGLALLPPANGGGEDSRVRRLLRAELSD